MDITSNNMAEIKEIPPLEPSPEIIDTLEEILEEAKNGKIRSIAIACSKSDGLTSSTLIAENYVILLLGELTVLQGRILEHLKELNGRL